jgi:hypothetical protein
MELCKIDPWKSLIWNRNPFGPDSLADFQTPSVSWMVFHSELAGTCSEKLRIMGQPCVRHRFKFGTDFFSNAKRTQTFD